MFNSTEEPKLSILIVSRSAANMSRVLDVIAGNGLSCEFEVICSWNGNVEDIHKIMVPQNLYFRLVEDRPYNFSKNNNRLAALSRGDVILFLNDDVIPDIGAIPIALDALSEPGVGIVGINLRYIDGRLQHAGVFFREDGTPYHRLKHEVKWDDVSVANDKFVPCVTGAFLLIRRKEFIQLGFDEEFEVCGEDIVLNLCYREMFDREILYLARATAVHIENATRKITGETKTPPGDLMRIRSYALKKKAGMFLTEVKRPKVRIVTEKPGWIMHRKAEEIQKHMESVVINEDWSEADVHYYINYGYLRRRPEKGLVIANFTHYDPLHLAEEFINAARMVDHCVAVSESTANTLRQIGIPDSKISVILIGADKQFVPKLTVGIVGRIYKGGRKGDDIVRALLEDSELSSKIRIVSAQDGWGAPVWKFDDPADFYRSIDYLLVPSRIEGGPVPFMEALACGTMAIAPEIGVIPQFPHISYPVGDVSALKATLSELADEHIAQRAFLTSKMRQHNWEGWAFDHERLFRNLLSK